MKRLTTTFIVVALVLTACQTATETVTERVAEEVAEADVEEDAGVGEVDVDVDIDFGAGQNGEGQIPEIRIETDEGVFEIGGGDIPDGFPVPLPDGYTVVGVITDEFGSLIQVSYPMDRRDELVEYFDAWTGEHEGEWDTMTMTFGEGADSTMTSMTTYDHQDMSIHVGDCFMLAPMMGLAALIGGDVSDAVCVAVVTHTEG